jgi:hypothetical protein
MNDVIDLDELYVILRDVARRKSRITYSELSVLYEQQTGEWHEFHGTWDAPLGQLNNILYEAGLEPLSAVVVLKNGGEPGSGFWGSSPGVPAEPRKAEDRLLKWAMILKRVHAEDWPDELP